MITGFRSFWGAKLGRRLGQMADNFSPISLARGEGLRKMLTSDGRAKGFGQMWSAGSEHIGAKRKIYKEAGLGYRFRDYLSGYNMGDLVQVGDSGIMRTTRRGFHAPDLGAQIRKQRMAWRLGLPGAMVGAGVLQGFMGDNPVSGAIGFGAKAGGIVAGTSMMAQFGGRAGAWAGLATLGLSTVNALRSGDNFGPF